jgi:hypothetical protein
MVKMGERGFISGAGSNKALYRRVEASLDSGEHMRCLDDPSDGAAAG